MLYCLLLYLIVTILYIVNQSNQTSIMKASTSNTPTTNPVDKLLNEIASDLKERRYVNPQYYRENMAYFQRQADLMD